MNPPISFRFLLVTLAHAALVGILFLSTILPGLLDRSGPDPIPVDLVVEMPPGDESGTDMYEPDTAPSPAGADAEPEPEPEEPGPAAPANRTAPDADTAAAKDDGKQSERRQPKDKRQAGKKERGSAIKGAKGKPGVEVSRKRVRNPYGRPDGKPPKKRLTPAEIKRLLNAGARVGDHTTQVSDEQLYLETVRHTMYTAWIQPSAIDIDGLSVKVDIELGPGGTIIGRSVAVSSGNRIMDDSVQRAIASVYRIPGLPASFIAKHRRVRIVFELTGEQR